MDKWLSRISNATVISLSILAGYAIASGHFPLPHASGPARMGEYQPGDRVDKSRLGLTGRTLLLVTKSTCRYCTLSMAFYRSLPETVPILAIAAEDVDTNRKYLLKNLVKVTSVLSLKDTRLNIARTPTLILVEGDGRVVKLWRGKLDEGAQADVLSALTARP